MRIAVTVRCGIVLGSAAAVLAGVAPEIASAGRATTVVVTMTNSKLTLAPMYVPAGAVVFRIANNGTVARDFKIGGKRTAKIAAGSSAILKVDVDTEHNYPYYSAGRGHATLSGVIVIVPSACSSSVTATVTVRMSDAPISLSRTRVPCGIVRFVVTNAGTELHAFAIDETGSTTPAHGGLGATLAPGKSATMTVRFEAGGRAYYYCAVDDHDDVNGERGFLTVS
jgi:hypothetical protein